MNCPSCGYCSHCGRGGWGGLRPYYSQPSTTNSFISDFSQIPQTNSSLGSLKEHEESKAKFHNPLGQKLGQY